MQNPRPDLDVHPASDAERVAAFENVHDVWGRGLSLEEHVARRTASVQHQRAEWFVGTLDDRVVTSLGAYPYRFNHRGRILDGVAVGAVHTRAEYRGRGFAPQLIRAVEEYHAKRGVAISLLYTDVGVDYYARMGYRPCPSWKGRVEVTRKSAETGAAPDRDVHAQFRPVIFNGDDRSRTITELAKLHEAVHQRLPLYITRSPDHWDWLIRRSPNDEFYTMHAPDGAATGYVRFAFEDECAAIVDCGAIDPEDGSLRRLLAESLRLGGKRGAKTVTAWLPPASSIPAIFETTEREDEITMLKPLSNDVELDEDAIAAAGWFQMIEHV